MDTKKVASKYQRGSDRDKMSGQTFSTMMWLNAEVHLTLFTAIVLKENDVNHKALQW